MVRGRKLLLPRSVFWNSRFCWNERTTTTPWWHVIYALFLSILLHDAYSWLRAFCSIFRAPNNSALTTSPNNHVACDFYGSSPLRLTILRLRVRASWENPTTALLTGYLLRWYPRDFTSLSTVWLHCRSIDIPYTVWKWHKRWSLTSIYAQIDPTRVTMNDSRDSRNPTDTR